MDALPNFKIENLYCRSCFFIFQDNSYRYDIGDDFLTALNELLNLNLNFLEGSSFICDHCVNSVNSFTEFKKAIIEKQNQFNVLVASNQHRFIENIQNITTDVLKSETEPEIVVKELNVDIIETPSYSYIESISPKKIRFSYKKAKIHKELHQGIAKSNREFCIECNKYYADITSHNIKHHDLPYTYSCPKCAFKCFDKKEFRDHKINVHYSEKEDKFIKKFICPFCARFVRCVEDHIAIVHHNEKNFYCDLCPFSSYKRSPFEEHMKSKHLPKNIKCSLCDFTTCTQQRLKSHIVNRHESRQDAHLPCPYCSKLFRTKYAVEYHINRKHKCDMNFSCAAPGCKRAFHTNVEMLNHYKNIHGPKTIICDVCGNYFSTKSMLMKHKTIHEEYKFICEFCNLKCRTRGVLNIHIKRKHTFQKDHKCDLCGHQFFRLAELSHHVALEHLGIRYECGVAGCNSTLSRKDAYLTHLKSHTNLTEEDKKELMRKLKEFVEKHNLKR